jgi:hypothetical protein
MKGMRLLITGLLVTVGGCNPRQQSPTVLNGPPYERPDRVKSTTTAKLPSGEAIPQDRHESEAIDLFTANLFHKRLSKLSEHDGIQVSYRGALAQTRGRPGFVPTDPEEAFLKWWVGSWGDYDHLGRHMFTLCVSMKKRPGCLAQCVVNGKTLYLEVCELPEGRTIDDPVPGLAGDDKVTPRLLLKELCD